MSYQFAKLSLEQENLVPIYQRKWRNIALSTQRVDRKKAAEAELKKFMLFVVLLHQK